MKRKITSIILLICLISPIVLPFQNTVQAATTTPKLQLLEITDGATTSTLTTSQQSNYDVTTMPIKKFVADRSELDGKFDAIYFASGTYSTELVLLDPDPTSPTPNKILTTTNTRKTNNLTKTKMNDLTLLKANEIINYYIKRNLPVIFHSSVKNQVCNAKLKLDNQCVIKNLAKNYVISSYPNVIYVDDTSGVKSLSSNRPRFQLSSMPEDSKTDTTPYTTGDAISFTFSIDKGTPSDLTANLYIDSNFNTKYEPSELVKQDYVKNLSSSDSKYTLNYILPKGYSGVRMWKIELVSANGLKDYETGTLRFRDVKVDIHVLQVTKTSSKNGSLRTVLKKENVGINTDGVIDTTDYKMTIDVISMDEFNNTYYKKLNTGLYNMIVFGFEDSYGNVRISNTNAQQAVKDFIASGQSIFMTHDTIQRIPSSGSTFETTNSWIENFLPDTGQTYELGVMSDWKTKTEAQKLTNPGYYYMETNLGYQAPYLITKANKVNNALITSFPYPLSDTITLATTHSQYFTLDLEDPEVIPLYNLSNPSDTAMDSNDSYNMYYIYKRKNITYSGAGHTNSTFSVDEQKLFVNTMLSSFIGANQAPTITVNSPDTTKDIPTTQAIPLSFKVDDIDLNDTNLNYSILLNGVQIYSGTMLNGETINKEISHNLVNDGTATITIKAWDLKGAQAGQKDLVIKVKKLDENLSISRTISKSSMLKVGETVHVNYTITPNSIDGTNLQNGQALKVQNIKFQEIVPSSFTISSQQSNVKVMTNADKTKTISYDLDSITYSKNIKNIYVANPISFQIDYTPTVSGDNTFAKSSLAYTSVDNTQKTLTFNNINVNARDELKEIKTPEAITMNLNSTTPQKIVVDYNPTNALASGIIKEIKWEKIEDIQDLITLSSSGEVSIKSGSSMDGEVATAKVKLTVTDLFGNVKEAFTTVNITNPLQSILIDESLTLNVGEKGSLNLIVVPASATNRLTWSIDQPELVNVNRLTGEVEGLKKGIATITIKGIGENNKEMTKKAVVTVKQPVTAIDIDSPIIIGVGEQVNLLNLTKVLPENANNRNVVYSIVNSIDRTYVALTQEGLLTANLIPIDSHFIKIKVSSIDGSEITKIFEVQITSSIKGIILPAKLDLSVGETYGLIDKLEYIPSNTTQKGIAKWNSSNEQIIKVDPDGTIHAISEGDASITAISKYGNYTATTIIHVYDPSLRGIELPVRLDLAVGQSYDLTSLIRYSPSYTTEIGISDWISSDYRFVQFISSGTIKGVSKGYAKVTAISKFRNKKATILINVYDPKEGNGGSGGNNLKW